MNQSKPGTPSRTTDAARERGRQKTKSYRDRLRAQGLRPIQIWVPDVRSRHFLEEARRQSRVVAGSPEEDEVNDFLAASQDWSEE